MLMRETDVREHLNNATANLAGWVEPSGHLVASEPEPRERAVIRIRLRAVIRGLRLCLGESTTDRVFDADDHRDMMRIYDEGLRDGATDHVNPSERGLAFK